MQQPEIHNKANIAVMAATYTWSIKLKHGCLSKYSPEDYQLKNSGQGEIRI